MNHNTAAAYSKANDPRLQWADWCLSLGFSLFVLANGKIPAANCPRCDRLAETYEPHDGETCGHLTCHGHQAASQSTHRVAEQLRALPRGGLAVRTGRASGVFVMDFDTKNNGVELLDRWSDFYGWELPRTLTAHTPSGGYHLLCHLPSGATVKSGSLVPGALDIKSEGGFVALPSGIDGRRWLDPSVPIAEPSPELLAHVTISRRVGSARAGSKATEVDRLPPTGWLIEHGWERGSRDQDAHRLACRLWYAHPGNEQLVVETMRAVWEATPQPVGDVFTWEMVLRKVEYARAFVEPRVAQQRAWALKLLGRVS